MNSQIDIIPDNFFDNYIPFKDFTIKDIGGTYSTSVKLYKEDTVTTSMNMTGKNHFGRCYEDTKFFLR